MTKTGTDESPSAHPPCTAWWGHGKTVVLLASVIGLPLSGCHTAARTRATSPATTTPAPTPPTPAPFHSLASLRDPPAARCRRGRLGGARWRRPARTSAACRPSQGAPVLLTTKRKS